LREIREYVPGDPIRRVYWKKSAKHGKLVIKLFEDIGEIPLSPSWATPPAPARWIGWAASWPPHRRVRGQGL
jgi:hypothetical protein